MYLFKTFNYYGILVKEIFYVTYISKSKHESTYYRRPRFDGQSSTPPSTPCHCASSCTPEHPGLSRTRRPFSTRSGPDRCKSQCIISIKMCFDLINLDMQGLGRLSLSTQQRVKLSTFILFLLLITYKLSIAWMCLSLWFMRTELNCQKKVICHNDYYLILFLLK